MMLSRQFAILLLSAALALSSEVVAQTKKPALSIGGEPVVTYQRWDEADKSKPQFLEVTILPGRGMAVLQIKAYLPGKGEIDLLNAPPLPEAERLLDHGDDEFGDQIFKIGGAILLPYANRIRGKVSADGKTITATAAGKTVTLPANWSSGKPGAEKHSIHGLMRTARFQPVVLQDPIISGYFHAGNFDGHWLSDTDVKVETILTHDALGITVTAKNVGHEPLPMGIGWHPYFVLPSGDRAQARLYLPAKERAVMNNYDDTFTTGERVAVKGTAYDYSAPGGRPLGTQYLDDNFSELQRNAKGEAVAEIIDPAANYGLRLIALSPEIQSMQVYAPPNKSFVAIEPQFNLPDPYNKNWGSVDTGMVLLKPGQSVSWHVRLELFTPNSRDEGPGTRGHEGK